MQYSHNALCLLHTDIFISICFYLCTHTVMTFVLHNVASCTYDSLQLTAIGWSLNLHTHYVYLAMLTFDLSLRAIVLCILCVYLCYLFVQFYCDLLSVFGTLLCYWFAALLSLCFQICPM